jgi:hypothetical protein
MPTLPTNTVLIEWMDCMLLHKAEAVFFKVFKVKTEKSVSESRFFHDPIQKAWDLHMPSKHSA